MSFFGKNRNDALICELRRELNSDILLFGADGFVYFGHLQSVEDCRLAILTPAICSATCDVEILTPGGCLVTVDYVRVDLCGIVAKGTGIVNDPVYCPDSCQSSTCCRKEDAPDAPTVDLLSGQERQDREFDCMHRHIKRLIGDNIALTSCGGFLFEGILSDVCNNLAILTIDQIFIPGCNSFISDRKIRSVLVNLDAVTSVAGGRTTRC